MGTEGTFLSPQGDPNARRSQAKESGADHQEREAIPQRKGEDTGERQLEAQERARDQGDAQQAWVGWGKACLLGWLEVTWRFTRAPSCKEDGRKQQRECARKGAASEATPETLAL